RGTSPRWWLVGSGYGGIVIVQGLAAGVSGEGSQPAQGAPYDAGPAQDDDPVADDRDPEADGRDPGQRTSLAHNSNPNADERDPNAANAIPARSSTALSSSAGISTAEVVRTVAAIIAGPSRPGLTAATTVANAAPPSSARDAIRVSGAWEGNWRSQFVLIRIAATAAAVAAPRYPTLLLSVFTPRSPARPRA
ncbi:MAG: hypothetical protein ACRDS9_17875, partial [Pseudonocardiaceae bacterium]